MIKAAYGIIWTPDIEVFGEVDKSSDFGLSGRLAVINSNSVVVVWPTEVHRITCVVDIRKYPFDEQKCKFDLCLWSSHDGEAIIIAEQNIINMSMYISNGEWQLDVQHVYSYTIPYANATYTHVIFPFVIRRKWQFIVLNTFFPTVCTSLLTLLCFCLPTESGERVGLSISIFLTLAVFMTVTSNDLPETADEVSLLGAYVALQLAWSGMTIVLTVLSLNLAFKKHGDIPRWLVKVTKIGRPKRHAATCIEFSNDTADESKQTKWARNLQDEHVAGNDAHDLYRNRNIDISWEYITYAFNRLCLYGSIIWQCGLHIWCLFRIYS